MERTYILRNISLSELSKVVDELWGKLQTDPQTQQAAREEGIAPEKLSSMVRTDVLSIRRDSSGFDPITTAVVVAFSPVAARIVTDVWEKFILPKLLQLKGDDSLVPQRDPFKH